MHLNVLVLGEGVLGKLILEQFSSSVCHARSISIRESGLSILNSVSYSDLVIDCMDPSYQDTSFSPLNQSIRQYRKRILQDLRFRYYAYVSSANIYRPSITTVDENSNLLDSQGCTCSEYIKNKLETEAYLSVKLRRQLRILRPVSLWNDFYPIAAQGFFPDLIRSRAQSIFLPARDGDQNIISFMHYFDAAQFVKYVLSTMINQFTVINVSSRQWASRKSLKEESNTRADPTQVGRRIISKILTNEMLPFTLRRIN